jgi:hypothetical protein
LPHSQCRNLQPLFSKETAPVSPWLWIIHSNP